MTQQPTQGVKDDLDRERDLLAAIVATAPTVINSFHRDPDGRVWYGYGAERVAVLFGVDPQELRNDAAPVFERIVPAEDREAAHRISLQSAIELVPWQAEYRVIHPTDGERWLHGHSIPHREQIGRAHV